MYNSMLSEQYDLSWGTDEPFLLIINPIKLQLLDSKSKSVIVRKSDVLVLRSVQSNSAGIDQGSLEVIEKIVRVFNPNTDTN